jgi:uncharacterized surface protein with fasciclin (FAS1) repeats
MKRSTFNTVAAMAALIVSPALAKAQTSAAAENVTGKTIVQVAIESGKFNTLVGALKAAGLVETLEGPGPFTVFAPSDDAFAKLPAGTIQALVADRERLTAILTYHVVAGKVMSADIVKANGAMPKTVNGQTVDVVVRGGTVYVNRAKVVSADIVASNGVIHVIDTVLMPKAATAQSGR